MEMFYILKITWESFGGKGCAAFLKLPWKNSSLRNLFTGNGNYPGSQTENFPAAG